MTISAVFSPKITHRKETEYDRISLISFLTLGAGLFFGTVIYIISKDYLTGSIWEYFINFTTDFSAKSNIEIISGLIISHLPFVILSVILGTNAFGTPFIFIMSFIKTLGLGLISSYIYTSYGLKGIEYSVMVFFPGKFVLFFSMLMLMHICTDSSLKIKRSLAGENQIRYSLGEYLAKVSVCVLCFLISAIVDFLAIICFSSLFSFS